MILGMTAKIPPAHRKLHREQGRVLCFVILPTCFIQSPQLQPDPQKQPVARCTVAGGAAREASVDLAWQWGALQAPPEGVRESGQGTPLSPAEQ